MQAIICQHLLIICTDLENISTRPGVFQWGQGEVPWIFPNIFQAWTGKIRRTQELFNANLCFNVKTINIDCWLLIFKCSYIHWFPDRSSPRGSGSGKGRSHRGRTVLTEKQRTILTACFQHNPKPDALLKVPVYLFNNKVESTEHGPIFLLIFGVIFCLF